MHNFMEQHCGEEPLGCHPFLICEIVPEKRGYITTLPLASHGINRGYDRTHIVFKNVQSLHFRSA